MTVAPFVGAWIEITVGVDGRHTGGVAPFVGAWIEITYGTITGGKVKVAPFVGAWIEIDGNLGLPSVDGSLRSSERGLKYLRGGLTHLLTSRSVRRSVD